MYASCQKHQLKVTVCVDAFNALLPERFSRGENVDWSLWTKAKTLKDYVRKVRKNCTRAQNWAKPLGANWLLDIFYRSQHR